VVGPTVAGPRSELASPPGRAVVVKFFAEYCEPCKRSLPIAARLSSRHPDVVFIGVSEDEFAGTAQALARRYELPFTVIHDASGATRGRFRVTALPLTVVADRAGVVRWVGGANETEDELSRVLDAIH
jgi:thiol-disulfide isomerase/thioredoxin